MVKTLSVWLIAWLLLVSIAWFGLNKYVVFSALIIAFVIVWMILERFITSDAREARFGTMASAKTLECHVMKKRVRIWFCVKMLTGFVTGVLFLTTFFARDWIETLFGWDPDQYGGSVEWLIVVGLFVVTAMLFTSASIEWRRAPDVSVQ